jgi:catechol 2,3-dioxygenase-like lactoylglutathione lyase family enzyme
MAGIDHLDLAVGSLERSLGFYRGLLGPLGWDGESEITGERGERVVYLTRSDQGSGIGLREARTALGEVDRYAVGLHHLCLTASSREQVDERAAWAAASGAEMESEPAEYDYLPGYYAAFFHDPDGLKLEIVHIP